MSAFAYDLLDDSQSEDDPNAGKFIVGVYFDGTHNNRYNVEAREKVEKGTASEDEKKAYKKHKEDTSYENFKSNVDLAEENASSKMETIYVQGIATMKLEGDEGFGAGSHGRGAEGIRGKVHNACKDLEIIIPKKTKEMVVDVFGFSRGAAAARNFVHEITRDQGVDSLNDLKNIDSQRYFSGNGIPTKGFLGYYLKANGKMTKEEVDALKITIRFVGVYDTVASYDKDSWVLPSFDSEHLASLGLNTIRSKTSKTGRESNIVHIVAENEYRKNFALTPVNVGKTFTIPGSHADIGGCYPDNLSEKKEGIIVKKVLTLQCPS